jgi:RHS repeat-associated protein
VREVRGERGGPWGTLSDGVVSAGLPRETSTSGYAYTAREWDPEINLYYYRARYYDPKVGRFLSEDPSGLVGGKNLYVYARNSGLRLRDPFGLCPEKDCFFYEIAVYRGCRVTIYWVPSAGCPRPEEDEFYEGMEMAGGPRYWTCNRPEYPPTYDPNAPKSYDEDEDKEYYERHYNRRDYSPSRDDDNPPQWEPGDINVIQPVPDLNPRNIPPE